MARRATNMRMSASARRSRYIARKAVLLLMAIAAAAILATLDKGGVFGKRRGSDWSVYHNKTFHVVRVVDGDTILLAAPDGDSSTTTVRLWGVDTPETVKPDHPVEHFGPQASRFTTKLVADEMVRIELERNTRDKYGRLLAFVYLPDGRMLNRVLIEQGYGYADPRFEHSHKDEFHRLHVQAKAAGVGLWKDVSASDLPDYLKR
jgi:endonuclease YncB( thermonuclease family)